MSRVRRASLRLVGAGLLAVLGFLVWERVSFDRAAWLADYEQLREHVPAAYANLLWTLREREIDPVDLHARTLRRLEAASTDREARAAITAFVDAFADGHFVVRRVKLSKRIAAWWQRLGSSDDEASVTAAMDGEAACRALGFHGDGGGLRFGLADTAEFSALETSDNVFPAGTLTLANGQRIGVVRIPSFDQQRYQPACLRAWDRFRGALGERCDEACVERFVHIAVPNQLLAELSQRATVLAAEGVGRIVVDVTGNGGGTDWVDAAARIFSAKPLVCPRLAFIKHRHWSARLSELRGEVDEDLRVAWPPEGRATLALARERIDRLLASAQEPCDLRSIWTDATPPSCSNLVEDEYYACGVFGDLPPGQLAAARSQGALFKALRYTYQPGEYQGPLAVLVDGRTASAAEHFAAMLADNQAAAILGARTHGSGCGYTNGGVPALLRHSGLTIAMPDCQRRRRDGSNELAGIVPDVVIAWTEQDDETGARTRLLAALAGL